MNFRYLLAAFFLGLLTVSCAPKGEPSARIAWDGWGVPHITAQNAEDLFYAQGWAQMHNHANLILRLYGRSRGKGAEYWGEGMLQDDLLVHSLHFEELAEAWEKEQDPETKGLLDAFVNGMNA